MMPSTLKTLILSQNHISSVELLCCTELPSLQSLYLSGNKLTSAKSLRRLHCPELKNIYLNGNLISDFLNYDQFYLKSGAAVDLVNLEYTLDEVNTTAIKVGLIFAPRARCKAALIVYK